MARLIKRYANRKLYDTVERRYVTLEELAVLTRAGEELQVMDNSTGGDITGVVLSKAISEMLSDTKGGEKSKQPAIAELLQKRSDTVVDYLKQGLAASMRTVKDVEEQLQQRWKRVTTREENGSATEELRGVMQRMIDESVHYLITKMNLPTRSEISELNMRLDEIERALKMRRRQSSKTGRATPAAKAGARSK